ncbi:MAG: SusF/SusE family outer membrane protein [Bacteroidales bacterium]|nr:SusF/SusE family outer membrane protein [Bacteroidales bacterium]
MRNNFIKGSAMFMLLAAFSMFTITSCDPEEEPNPIPVEDGLYIKGGGTALDSLAGDGLMTKAKNEVLQEVRTSLYEFYIAVEAGTEGFNLVNVVGGVEEMWGPASDFMKVDSVDLDIEEPTAGLWKGSYEVSETPFTVPEDGLYHVMVDTELGVMAVAKVEWGLIGGATPGGWSDDTEFTASAFDLETITWSVDEVTMLEGDYKFRYSGGWKVILDTVVDLGEGNTGVRVNTNFGGSLDALDAGGDNIANAEYAVYKMEITWSLSDGYSATQTFVKDAETLPEYPDELYMVGASIGGWDWVANGKQLIPVHSNPHLFWKIVYIEAGVADAGIKFAPAPEWVGDFGIDAEAGATDGVYDKGSDNVPDVAESGYYNIVVNLLDETIEVNPAMVYGIGDPFGDWDASTHAFTVDNTAKTVTSPAFVADGELRIHTAASTMTNADGNPVDWWQAEFIVLDGNIEYRGAGGDQARVNVTTGQTVTLDFTTETGVIE